jgi:erythromycin esterase
MLLLTLAASALSISAPGDSRPVQLTRGSNVPAEIGSGEVKEAFLRMRAGESAEMVVEQQGVDVAVEVFSPSGSLLDAIDSPNGRQGPEPVSLVAREGGAYRLRISPLGANDPGGRINIRVVALRNVAQTRHLLAERQRARGAAARWFGRLNSPLPSNGRVGSDSDLPPFDDLASNAVIIGLGEATHGSREFNDFRLALVQRLVVRHGYRLIALEDSASRWRSLEDYVSARSAAPASAIEWGWIGRRSRRQLLEWARQWNVEHPGDLIRVIGVDAQDNEADREQLGGFLSKAYGEAAAAAWKVQAEELAEADGQTAVFGNSSTSATSRELMQEIVAQLSLDGALLRARFGEEEYRAALSAAQNLYAFVDFNSGAGVVSHSRDWHMAATIMRAISESEASPKAVYWAHNAHVSAAATRWGPTGALLRQAIGCNYRAVAATFDRGGFIAQVAGDRENRLAAIQLAASPPDEDRVETVLGSIRPGAHFSVWRCGGETDLPPWLQGDRPMRWVGGVFAPDGAASASYQAYRVPVAFDAIAYFPMVSAETIPEDRAAPPPSP